MTLRNKLGKFTFSITGRKKLEALRIIINWKIISRRKLLSMLNSMNHWAPKLPGEMDLSLPSSSLHFLLLSSLDSPIFSNSKILQITGFNLQFGEEPVT